MMATPPRELVLADLKTAIEAITTANGFKTNINTVERSIRDWSEVGAGRRPWVGVAPFRQVNEKKPGDQIRTRLFCYLVAHLEGATPEARAQAVSDFEDDLFAKLVNATYNRSGNATDTWINSMESDEGDPDGGATVVAELEVIYHRGTEAS